MFAATVLAGTMIALTAGCGAVPDGAAPRPTVAGAPTGPAAPSPALPSTDPILINTHEVCAAINQAVTEGSSAFGTDLGAMVGHLAGRNRTAADAARDSALRRLASLAATVRMRAATALDPAVRAAAEDTAGNLDRVAADPGLLAGVKAITDMGGVLGRITGSADPLTNVCA